LFLGLVLAGFPAVSAIILPILSKSDGVVRLTQSTVLDARAFVLQVIADEASKFFGHSEHHAFELRSPLVFPIVAPGAGKIKLLAHL
jgi:hypothetical protein